MDTLQLSPNVIAVHDEDGLGIILQKSRSGSRNSSNPRKVTVIVGHSGDSKTPRIGEGRDGAWEISDLTICEHPEVGTEDEVVAGFTTRAFSNAIPFFDS